MLYTMPRKVDGRSRVLPVSQVGNLVRDDLGGAGLEPSPGGSAQSWLGDDVEAWFPV